MPNLLQQDTCPLGHDVRDKENSLFFQNGSRRHPVCKECMSIALDPTKVRRTQGSLLHKNQCRNGHDVRDKANSLYLALGIDGKLNPVCRECRNLTAIKHYYKTKGIEIQTEIPKITYLNSLKGSISLKLDEVQEPQTLEKILVFVIQTLSE